MTVNKKRILTYLTTTFAVVCHLVVFYTPLIQTKKGLSLRDLEGAILKVGPGEKFGDGSEARGHGRIRGPGSRRRRESRGSFPAAGLRRRGWLLPRLEDLPGAPGGAEAHGGAVRSP